MTEWSLWVLGHGLPPLPQVLGRDESVPIARWVGSRLAAVEHIQWWQSGEPGEPDELQNEIELFVRRADGWEVSSGSGGSNWYDPPFERPSGLSDADVWFGGEVGTGGDGWYACGIDGIAGKDAATVEVESGGTLTSMPIESHIGAFVVALDAARAALIRVRRADRAVMGERTFEGHDWARV